MNSSNVQHNISETLVHLRTQLYDLSGRNPFVHINQNRLFYLAKPIDPQLRQIYQKQQFYLKEFGLETTLFIGHFIKWKLPNKSSFFISPLLFKPCRIKREQKITLRHQIDTESDQWHVNPILAFVWSDVFDLSLDPTYEDASIPIELIQNHFNTEANRIISVSDFNQSENWEIISLEAVGTFNYKKSVLGSDYEAIINAPNDSVKTLLGFKPYQVKPAIEDGLEAFPIDSSQKEVVAESVKNSLVVQGPPGTGKSHTIVAMIQQYMLAGKKVLFVSEKKSALDVVYDRMAPLQEWVAYLDASSKPKKTFYKGLGKSIETALNRKDQKPQDEFEFNVYHQDSTTYIDQYFSISPRTGQSLYDLESYLISAPYHETDYHPNSQVPDFKSWHMYQDDLKVIEQVAQQKWGVTNLSDSAFLELNPSILQDKNPLEKISKRTLELNETIGAVMAVQMRFDLNLTWDDFTKLCISASILSLVNKRQMDLLIDGSKSFKSFNNWAKKYQVAKAKYDMAIRSNSLWENKPNLSQLNLYMAQLELKGLGAWFKKRQYHQQFFKAYQGNVSIDNATPILEDLKREFELEHQLEELKIKLKHNLNIFNPDTEIDEILDIRKRLAGLSHNTYQIILERDQATECITALSKMNLKIGQFNRIKSYLFKDVLPNQIEALANYLKQFNQRIGLLQDYLPEIKALLTVPNKILEFIKLNPSSIDALAYKVYHHTLQNEQRFIPFLNDLDGVSLQRYISKYNQLKLTAYQNRLVNLSNAQCKIWNALEHMSQLPHAKLNDEQKQKKRLFKQAKRLIIHEVNKQQRHLPIKSLLDETAGYVLDLLPVWMMNPLAIAERLPLEKDAFDVVIFDESSQIPLEDAIPAIYRAKQVIIVGDDKQMPPSQFFSTKTTTLTLLDQGHFVFPSSMLKWHYRSQHPDLISFSSHQFYDSQLQLFPPINGNYPIVYHAITDGIFENQVNIKEAQAVQKRLSELINQGIGSIAVIAFSKAQEDCLRRVISKSLPTLPEEVLIRNLENVQGIERDIVLISVGYAQNPEGKLRLNFGPVNHEKGANRLNVLLTRARTRMEVFTGIDAQDIGLSENNGLMVLKDFLKHAQGKGSLLEGSTRDVLANAVKDLLDNRGREYRFYAAENGLIIDAFIDRSHQKILLVNPGAHATETIDLNIVLAVLNKSFKAVKIVLNQDWLTNKTRTEAEILDFFRIE